jgi:hypothetical protein
MYRKIGKELNQKMIGYCIDKDSLTNSAKLLGIPIKGNTMIFDTEDEMSVLMDFALNDYCANKKNALNIYQEKIGGQNEIEKEILRSLLLSYTSLFKVISISGNILWINDILNKKSGIKLIDINFSKTGIPGMLLFFRLIPFKEFSMTSGVPFAFNDELEDFILKKYNTLSKKVKSGSNSIDRFVSFFKLSKNYGIEVMYE